MKRKEIKDPEAADRQTPDEKLAEQLRRELEGADGGSSKERTSWHDPFRASGKTHGG